LSTNGDCGGSGPSQFLIAVQGGGGEFPDQDVLVDFGGGVTQYYDAHHWYVVDANGIIIGSTYGNNFATNTGVAGDSFFSINQRPTGTGNFTVYLQDEADGVADQSVGATYVAGSTQRASTSFNGAALDPDCVPAASPDTTDPVVTVPANIALTTSAGAATRVVTYSVSASDNVGVTTGPTLTAGLASGSAFPLGTTTVTHTATDAAGNVGTGTFTVTITDAEQPVVTVPSTMILNTDPGQSTATVTYSVSAADNVGIISGPTLTAGLASGSAFPIGTTAVTYTAMDAAGNIGSATFSVIVNDTQSPILTTPSDITVNVDAGTAGAVVTYLATATDNVPGVTISYSTPPGALFSVGTTTVTAIATDVAGNMTAGTFSVTVVDNEAPVLSAPATAAAGVTAGQSTGIVNFSASAVDVVDGAITPTFTSSPTAGLAPGSAFPIGVTTVAVRAEDQAGNIATQNVIVTVTDGEDPILTIPADITVNTDPASATAVVTYSVTATDNSGAVTPVLVSGPASGSAFPVGTTAVTWSVTDPSGNIVSDTFNVTVSDNGLPVVSVPADVAVNTDAGLPTAIVTFTATVLDAVDGALVPVITSAPTTGLASGSAFPIGTTTVTVAGTDIAGNTASDTFEVVVADNQAPTFSSTQADINLEVDFNLTSAVATFPTPTASDNSGIVNVAQTQGFASGSSFPLGTTLVEFTATDGSGRTSVLQFNVTVSQIPPGSVTFIVNSPDDGTVTFSSSAAALNTSVIVSGGTGSAFGLQVVPGSYTASYSVPSGFAVTSGSCSSSSGSVDTASQTLTLNFASAETYTCTLVSRNIAAQTQEQIQSFMDARARLITANQPAVGRRIARVDGAPNPNTASMFGHDLSTGVMPFGVSVGESHIHLSFSSASASLDPLTARSEWDIWFEGSFTRYETSYGEGSFAIIHAGADYRIAPNAILGFGFQMDSAEEDVIGSTATTSGLGWMAGPYFTARIGEALYFDASLSYGRSTIEISPLGTYMDDFETERWLARMALFGSHDYSDALNIRPSVALSFFEETSEAYVDSLSVLIPSVTTRFGEVEIGSRFTWSDPVAGSETFFEFEAIYSFSADGTSHSELTDDPGMRGRVGVGGRVLVGTAGTVNYGLSYDGLGDEDFEAITAALGYQFSF
jgi:hypothetical protein